MIGWIRKGVLCGLLIVAPIISLAACGHAAGEGGGVSATGTTGPTQGVVVEVGASSYAATDAIAVTVRNDLSASIIATDHQTSCTIVQLQMQVNGAWQNQGGCALGMATRQVPLAAGSSTAVSVSPSAGQISARPWPAGSYRVAFSYRASANASASDTVYSAPFTVS